MTTQLQHHRCRLNYVAAAGQGNPLLLLHGVTRRWQTFRPLWASLSPRWQMHAFDFRGHGLSQPAAGRYQVCDYMEDALAYLESRVQKPVILYGHSLGAMVAAGVAAELGDRVAAIVMEDPPLNTMGNRIDQTSLLEYFSALRPFAGDTRSAGVIGRALAEIRLRDPPRDTEMRLGDIRDAVSLRFMASCLKQLDPEVLTPIVAGTWLDRFDSESVFQRVQCPALLIQADPQASGMLIDDDASAIEQWAPDLVRVKLEDCGHVIHWSHTTLLLNHVHGFLESLCLPHDTR